jgi:prepilin-type N-terminal cleavage/methylation domain-containing protein
MEERDYGFTLIELLVVIIIIGILASIVIPVYLKQREKAYQSHAVNDMKNAATAVESYATENAGSYLALNGADQTSPLLTGEGFRQGVWTSLSVVSDVGQYCIRGQHVKLPGMEFVYRSGAGVVQVGSPGVVPC